MPEPLGTSSSRNRVFTEASGEAVMCLDCHVLLAEPFQIERLIRWYDTHPGTMDLYQAPMFYDGLYNHSTHFNNKWRAEMWGTWGMAWRCRCSSKANVFTMIESGTGESMLAFAGTMDMQHDPVSKCSKCGK